MSYSRGGRGRRPDSRSRSRSRSRGRSRSYDPDDAQNPGNNLYITGLSTRVTTRELERHFQSEGKVLECHLVVDPRTRESRGFGFVTMETIEDADRCIKYLNRSVLEGRVIAVEKVDVPLPSFSTVKSSAVKLSEMVYGNCRKLCSSSSEMLPDNFLAAGRVCVASANSQPKLLTLFELCIDLSNQNTPTSKHIVRIREFRLFYRGWLRREEKVGNQPQENILAGEQAERNADDLQVTRHIGIDVDLPLCCHVETESALLQGAGVAAAHHTPLVAGTMPTVHHLPKGIESVFTVHHLQ
ncbi:UBP1-associated proteins 1C isoform X2 [Amborella trichopoda]|uniref:UBP1-associated proteins 1C isoform X2 n=1 Tax=Amborella trichopoda TaxID=13333 RepID=UPI0009C076E7|nr:UBP1-associated proteins 1C isoform X2 [Amborella trichopoda]|eukprot:XP_020525809.1 UBP1-associated proteins 1C isoform X2 [Amborella trichopoda]